MNDRKLNEDTLGAERQAVVLIHGVGNQRPMDSLRSFVDAVLGPTPGDSAPAYYSKPEQMSGTFELRRLQSRDSRPRTDYFELYWQHLVPRATWSKIVSWLALLLGRRPRDVPPALHGLWFSSWAVALVAVGLLLYTIIAWLAPHLGWTLAALPAKPKLPAGLAVAMLFLQGVVLNYAGDAAVYLSPLPSNIAARQAVREAGVALIERLHKGLDGRLPYDRIVIVGHSLGSVIGYDILTYAWPRFNEAHGSVAKPAHAAMKESEGAAEELLKAPSDASRQRWLRASRALWLEQRSNGFPWLITDFITLGSPLTHGLILLARRRAEFERKKRERELPTSPPQIEPSYGLSFPTSYELASGDRRTVSVLNHGALFAHTLWTNLYFPARYWFKGDAIGGPVSGEFGPGVVDVEVRTSRLHGWLAHTGYWSASAADRGVPASAINRLVAALDLRRRAFRPPQAVAGHVGDRSVAA